MSEYWQGIAASLEVQIPGVGGAILAQVPVQPPVEPVPTTSPAWIGFFQGIGLEVGPLVVNLLGAIAILLIGWLIAGLLSAAVRGLLRRTNLDNRLADMVTGQPSGVGVNVESLAATIIFWLIMILAVVAALNVFNLTAVSQPLNSFLTNIFSFLAKLGGAAILLAIAWVLATLVKAVVTRSARAFSLDEKLYQSEGETSAQGQFLLSDALGNILYWFVFLLFLPSILRVLELQGSLEPVQGLLNEILQALPNILKAILIGFIGWLAARIVRGFVTNLLAATGTDRIGEQFGLSRSMGGRSLSWVLGTIAYVLVLLPVAIAALEALNIAAVSAPAAQMLQQILSALPRIFTAVLILIVAYVIGRFVADLVSNLLASIGFNNVFYWLGLQQRPYAPPPPPPPAPDATVLQEGQPTVFQEPSPSTRTPSEIVGIITLVGIMLFATIAATNTLQFEALTSIVTGLLVIFGRILSGLIVFAVGLYLANLAFNLISSSGNAQARVLAQTARIAIIALVSAMALQQMGIATDIVNLAFGLLLGSIAVAIALAFGLGGRDVAAEQIREWLNNFKQR